MLSRPFFSKIDDASNWIPFQLGFPGDVFIKKIIETTNNPRNLTASLPLKHDGWKLEDEFPFGSKPILRAMFNFRGVTTQYL